MARGAYAYALVSWRRQRGLLIRCNSDPLQDLNLNVLFSATIMSGFEFEPQNLELELSVRLHQPVSSATEAPSPFQS